MNAAGDTGPTLFVFQGRAQPYLAVIRGKEPIVETYGDYLPSGAVIAVRKERGGVDSQNFLCEEIHPSVQDLTENGRKILLTYDGYMAHMALAVLELFDANGIIAYTLPAHTSGKTQPCDVVLFGAYKVRLNESLHLADSTHAIDKYDEYSYCAMMSHAFEADFTRDNIKASCRRSGPWPLY